MWIIKSATTHILSLLFPVSCVLCREKGKALCLPCFSSFKRTVETPHPDTYSYLSYKDTNVRNMLQKIKYFRKLYLIQPIVEYIASDPFLKGFLSAVENPILIPIPMSKKRTLLRGDNHTEYIAKSISVALDIPIQTNFLLRHKDTLQQVHTHSRIERVKNMRKAFKVEEKYISELRNRTIILIDDVTTTGATIKEATETLRKAGCKNVKAITLAH